MFLNRVTCTLTEGWLAGNLPPQFWKLCIGSLELFRTVYHVNPKEITWSNYLIRQSFLSLFFHLQPISATILAVISLATITQEAYTMRSSPAKSPTPHTQMTDLKHITKFLHSWDSPKSSALLCEFRLLQGKWESHSARKNCWTNCLEISHAYANPLALRGGGAPCSLADYRIS